MSISSLEPVEVWRHFDDILRIPRPSGHEDKIREHILLWSARQGFDVESDIAGNLFVRVPAREGFETLPPIILQAHMDMVTEKESSSDIDFLRDPIEATIVDGFVCSMGTTLGADNGIGLAVAMAAAENQQLYRGALLLVFTVDEERGLTGAKGLDASKLEGNQLINLDSEDEAIYIGCAGAEDCHFFISVRREIVSDCPASLMIAVKGLSGGHSGVDIVKNNANAIKVLARLLYALAEEGVQFRIFSLDGGGSRNAIPREATALLKIPAIEEARIKALVDRQGVLLRKEFPGDPDLILFASRVPAKREQSLVFKREDQALVLQALLVCPHGVLAMSQTVSELVETSNNLAVVHTMEDQVEIHTLSRSSSYSGLSSTITQLKAISDLVGADFKRLGGYPAWEPNTKSPLVETAKRVVQRLSGKAPELRAVHGGLECAIIGSKSDLEMISLGPEIEGAHTPRERVNILSVGAFYERLLEIIREITRTR